jgi:RNA polymerase-binding protein DksA
VAKSSPAKKSAPAVKTAAARKAVPAEKAVPAKTAAPAKKAAPAKTVPAKTAVTKRAGTKATKAVTTASAPATATAGPGSTRSAAGRTGAKPVGKTTAKAVGRANGTPVARSTTRKDRSVNKDRPTAGVPSGAPAASAGPDPGGSPITDHSPPIAAADAAKGATMGKQADTRTTPTKQASAGESKATKVAPKTSRSAAETEKIRLALAARRDELKEEYEATISEITELQRDRLTDSAGDDQADTGTKTFEREQEISLANSILERVTQVERALERLDEGGYGWCERCGNPIPVERLAAFPSATLCVTCKQLEERR